MEQEIVKELTIEEKLQALKELEEKQGADGVWNQDKYMAGFHNGIVRCLHILGIEAEYKDLPKDFVEQVAMTQVVES